MTTELSTTPTARPEVEELADRLYEMVRARRGDDRLGQGGHCLSVQLRGRWMWSAVWFVDGDNRGFRVTDRPRTLLVELWAHGLGRMEMYLPTSHLPSDELLRAAATQVGLLTPEAAEGSSAAPGASRG